MKKRLLFLVMLLSLLPLVLGAAIHGRVFDYNLRLAENSIVRISTVPEQMIVSSDGIYSFNVPIGDYVITAFLKDESGTITYLVEENISVIDEGDYVRDLILFPSEDLDELNLENDIEQDLKEQEGEQEGLMPVHTRILISAGLILLLGIIVWLALRDKGKKKGVFGGVVGGEEPDDLAELLAFIRKHRRVTQKEIRKEFSLSEAKISLMITDLESQGKIRKIKKGRGNVIVYMGK